LEDRPEILAQVDWAVEKEMAATLQDVLIRRMQLFFRHRSQGLSAVEVVADRMSVLLRWDDEERARQVADFEREVALSRAWKGA
jgi:glycerol-3-phosphate dehydrogenase